MTAQDTCLKLVTGYEHALASIPEMREYAICIPRLHPEPFIQNEALAVKGAVLIMFLCIIIGIVAASGNRNHRGGWARWADAVIYGGPVGILAGITALAAAVMVWYCVRLLVA